MSWIKNIISFIKKLFYKEEPVKMIEEPVMVSINENSKSNFKDYLKMQYVLQDPVIKTRICIGDGLGIKNKIMY